MESNGLVTIFEGKNKFPENFAVYQLYHPYLYYHTLKENNQLPIKNISTCYLLRHRINGNSVLRVFNYTFSNPQDMTSIQLLKNAEYTLIQE